MYIWVYVYSKQQYIRSVLIFHNLILEYFNMNLE